MAGVFKSLDASDIRLTPFKAHKKWDGDLCYNNYFSNVNIHPRTLGVLDSTDAVLLGTVHENKNRLFAADPGTGKIYKLDTSDDYSILATASVPGLVDAEYRLESALKANIYGMGVDPGNPSASLALLSGSLTFVQGTHTNQYFTASNISGAFADISINPGGFPEAFIYGCGDGGCTSALATLNDRAFVPGTERTSSFVANEQTASFIGINADGKGASLNDRIIGVAANSNTAPDGVVFIEFTGSEGSGAGALQAMHSHSFSITAAGSGPAPGGGVYGTSTYGSGATYATNIPLLLNGQLGTRDIHYIPLPGNPGRLGTYYILLSTGHLYYMFANPLPLACSTGLVATGVADILVDSDVYIGGSYNTRKLHVVYENGEIGLDLQIEKVGSSFTFSFEKVVDCRKWASKHPIVKAAIHQNQTPATIGLFAGSTTTLEDSVHWTVNPDTYEISDPISMGATKGDLRIEGFFASDRYVNGIRQPRDFSIDRFIGYSSSYSNRFVEFPCTCSTSVFELYKADYNPRPSHPDFNFLNTLFDQGNPHFQYYEPITKDQKFQRVVHKSINHLFYESFYNNTKAVFGSGNINTQQRFLEDKAYIVDLAQSRYGERIQQGSIIIDANYSISGSNNETLKITDDLHGNLYVSGGLVSPWNPAVYVTSSVSASLVGAWPTRDVYKYDSSTEKNTPEYNNGYVSFESDFNRGNWNMKTQYNNIRFMTMSYTYPSASYPLPQAGDLLGTMPHFSMSFTSSIIISPGDVREYKQSYNFENSDFSITAMFNLDNGSLGTPTIITKEGDGDLLDRVDENGDVYTYQVKERCPYRLEVIENAPNRKLAFYRTNEIASLILTSSAASVQEGQLHHAAVIKSGSLFSLYLDSVLVDSGSEIEEPTLCSNKGNVVIGNRASSSYGAFIDIVPGSTFTGFIDNVKLYNEALTMADLSCSYHTVGKGDTIVGNVFYDHGMAVLGAIPARFMDIDQATARGTHTIYEKEVSCTVGAGEFNRSNNPSLQVYNPTNGQYEFRPFTTHSLFKPYVTSIGLYNDNGEMVAVAKLGTPTQLPSNTDTTFIVRYDK